MKIESKCLEPTAKIAWTLLHCSCTATAFKVDIFAYSSFPLATDREGKGIWHISMFYIHYFCGNFLQWVVRNGIHLNRHLFVSFTIYFLMVVLRTPKQHIDLKNPFLRPYEGIISVDEVIERCVSLWCLRPLYALHCNVRLWLEEIQHCCLLDLHGVRQASSLAMLKPAEDKLFWSGQWQLGLCSFLFGLKYLCIFSHNRHNWTCCRLIN